MYAHPLAHLLVRHFCRIIAIGTHAHPESKSILNMFFADGAVNCSQKRDISFYVFLYIAVNCSATRYANLKFILLLLFFVNVFVGDGVLDVPKSPEMYCISFYVILFGNVNCSAPRYA